MIVFPLVKELTKLEWHRNICYQVTLQDKTVFTKSNTQYNEDIGSKIN